MKIFGYDISMKRVAEIKSAPYSTNYANNVFNTEISGVQIARNYRTYWRMYRLNTDLRRCVEEIQNTTMKCGFEVRQKLANGKEKVVENAEFMRAIGGEDGANNLKNEVIKNLILFGNSFIVRRKNIRSGVARYDVLDSRYVSVVTDSDLKPLRYNYQNKVNNSIEVYGADEIIHVYDTLDLDNPVFGISKMESLVLDIMGDEEASKSNYYYFNNDAIPSAIYVLRTGLTADQQKNVFDVIKDTLKGGEGKHKNIVSSGVEDIKPIQQQHTDASFLEQRRYTTEKVCSATGVPRTIIGYVEDVNHSNGDSQYKKFIENTVRPWEERIEDIFTTILRDFEKDKNVYVEVIDEHIDDLPDRCKMASDNVKAGLWTINEARLYIGYEEVTDNELASQILVASNMQLLDNLIASEPTVPADENNPTPTTV